MSWIDSNIIFHRLDLNVLTKLILKKYGEDMWMNVNKEVNNLKGAKFISKIVYLTWLANVVVLKKSSGKQSMCVDFIDLNLECSKYPFSLSIIDINFTNILILPWSRREFHLGQTSKVTEVDMKTCHLTHSFLYKPGDS